MITMQEVFLAVSGLVALKALTIGSEFDFHLWFKYGKEYTAWYNSRPKFPENKS